MNLTIRHNTRLVGARDKEYDGFPIQCYDDGDGPIWVHSDEGGIRRLIRAKSFCAAWEILIDESPTISEDEVPEAYGFEGPNAQLKLQQAAALADAGEGEYPNLIEGYEYQSNSSGTGIVDVSDYWWLRELREEDLERIRLVIRSYDVEPIPIKFTVGSYRVKAEGDLPEGDKLDRDIESFSPLSDIGKILTELEQTYFGAFEPEVVWS